MITALASDVVVTWLAAIGMAIYLNFLRQQPAATSLTRALVFLVGALCALLALRGFYWLWGGGLLGRLVFAAATLLPLAITMVTEQLLRRHHPLWLKVVAAAVTVVFAVLNLVADLSSDDTLLIGFGVCLAAVVLANAALLLGARSEDLTANERRLTRAVLVSALISVPLVITDFREQFEQVPMRLGALAALLLVYVLLHGAESPRVAHVLVGRLVFSLVAACGLALAFAAATHGIGRGLHEATVRGLPVALAWVLLTMIVVRIASVSSQDAGQRFLRWLLLARLDSLEAFLRSLRRLPQTEEHVVLGQDELKGYSIELMFEADKGRRGPISLAEARAWARVGGNHVDAAEQLVDLLEKHEMTHALIITANPPLVVLLNLAHGIDEAVGSLRAGVIQKVARRLAQGSAAGA